MKRLLFLLLLTPFVITSCSTENAQKVADEFHKKLNEGKIDYIIDELVVELTENEYEEFENYLTGLHEKGKHENREKSTGFDKSIKNGTTTVKLDYTFEVKGETIYEALVLVDKGEGYKILAVSMHPNKDVVDEYTKDF